jgi:hypothetical protein
MHSELLRVQTEITRARDGEGRGADMASALARNFASLLTDHGVVFCGPTKVCKVHAAAFTHASRNAPIAIGGTGRSPFRHASSIADLISLANARARRRQTVWQLSLIPVALA